MEILRAPPPALGAGWLWVLMDTASGRERSSVGDAIASKTPTADSSAPPDTLRPM